MRNFIIENNNFGTTENFNMYTLFYISKTLTSNVRLKLPKNQVNTKQHPEAQLELFENYPHSSSTLSQNNRRYSKT